MCKVSKTHQHQYPLFVAIKGVRFLKNKRKNYSGLEGGLKLNLAAK
jgi:hypothetical protein